MKHVIFLAFWIVAQLQCFAQSSTTYSVASDAYTFPQLIDSGNLTVGGTAGIVGAVNISGATSVSNAFSISFSSAAAGFTYARPGSGTLTLDWAGSNLNWTQSGGALRFLYPSAILSLRQSLTTSTTKNMVISSPGYDTAVGEVGVLQWINGLSENLLVLGSSQTTLNKPQRIIGAVSSSVSGTNVVLQTFQVTTQGIRIDGTGVGGATAGALITSGTGTPEGVVTAGVGSLFLRTDGGAGSTLYVKESGTGNTGWVAK